VTADYNYINTERVGFSVSRCCWPVAILLPRAMTCAISYGGSTSESTQVDVVSLSDTH